MKRHLPIVLAAMLAIISVAVVVSRGFAQSPSPSPLPAPKASSVSEGVVRDRVIVDNKSTQPVPVRVVNPPVAETDAYSPSQDQMTGVWAGCGPVGNNGSLDAFNREHARSRIVQVFVDASVACPAKSYGFVVVYQDARRLLPRRTR